MNKKELIKWINSKIEEYEKDIMELDEAEISKNEMEFEMDCRIDAVIKILKEVKKKINE
jgi:hypothetical protein